MSQFLHDDNSGTKAIATPRVFSKKRKAKMIANTNIQSDDHTVRVEHFLLSFIILN